MKEEWRENHGWSPPFYICHTEPDRCALCTSSLRSSLTNTCLDDDKLADRRDPTLLDLGSIEVKLTYVRLGPEVEFKGYEAHNRGHVHERAKKLGTHYTSYVPRYSRYHDT